MLDLQGRHRRISIVVPPTEVTDTDVASGMDALRAHYSEQRDGNTYQLTWDEILATTTFCTIDDLRDDIETRLRDFRPRLIFSTWREGVHTVIAEMGDPSDVLIAIAAAENLRPSPDDLTAERGRLIKDGARDRLAYVDRDAKKNCKIALAWNWLIDHAAAIDPYGQRVNPTNLRSS